MWGLKLGLQSAEVCASASIGERERYKEIPVCQRWPKEGPYTSALIAALPFLLRGAAIEKRGNRKGNFFLLQGSSIGAPRSSKGSAAIEKSKKNIYSVIQIYLQLAK